MYLEHFGLNVAPFGLSHKLSFLYQSEAFQESMAHLLYGLDNREPIILITGPIGSGKTMALQSFLNNLGERYSFALVTNTKVTAVELLKLVLDDLGVDLPVGADKSDLLILLKDFLIRAGHDGRKILVVIDEAQDLSGDVLEEIRLLTNLGQGEEQPVQIVLAGQPELEVMVERPELAQLRQRIRVHYVVDPLTRREVEGYVNHRMRVAGCANAVFTTGALDRIHRLSGGIPRLVNTYSADGLLAAYVAGHAKVEAEDVGTTDGGRAQAPAAAVVPAAPEPAAGPGAAGQRTPPLRQPIMAERQHRRGSARPVWWTVAVVVTAAAALYLTGGLDTLRGTVAGWLARDGGTGGPLALTGVSAASPLPATTESGQGAPAVRPAPADSSAGAGADAAAGGSVELPAAATTAAADSTDGAPEPGGPSGRFFVHISSFRTPDRARTYVERWERDGVPAEFEESTVRDAEWFRVYLGPFPSRARALAVADSLKEAHDITYLRIVDRTPETGG